MEVKLRQRIIGAVVLAALAIIFLPLLFKSSTTPSTEAAKPMVLSAQIPPAPAKPAPAPAPQTIVMIQSKDLSTPDANNTMPANATSATTDNTNVLKAPTIQSNVTTPTPANKTVNMPINKSSSASATGQNINLIEDETLSPSSNTSKNVDTAKSKLISQSQIKSSHDTTIKSGQVASGIKPAKKPEKAQNNKHATELNKTSIVAKPTINKTAETSSKKPQTTKHPAVKTASPTETKTTTSKKTVSTTQTLTSTEPATSTHLIAAQNTKSLTGTAWEVRLGSFANETNVKQLIAQLRAHGFKAYKQPVQTSLGALTRVAIGPEVKREKATAIQQRLVKELNIKSEVVPFDPVAENK